MRVHGVATVVRISLAAALLLGAACRAQTEYDAKTAALLKSLASQNESYQKTLPNFACTEVINTTMKLHGKDKLHLSYQMEMRVIRDAKGVPKENTKLTNYMGKLPELGKSYKLIAYVDGGLAGGMPAYFAADETACNVYKLTGNRIDFTTRKPPPAGCDEPVSTVGFGLLDDAGLLLHGELRRDPVEARPRRMAAYATIDYASVRLGEETYRMPTHLYAEIVDNAVETRLFDAYFTGCRLYKVTSTIEPALSVIPEGAPEPKP